MTNERSSTSERTLVHQRTNARPPENERSSTSYCWTTVRSTLDDLERPPEVERPPNVERPPEVERPPNVERPPEVERPPNVERSPEVERPPNVERPSEVERLPNVDVRPKWNVRPMWNVRPKWNVRPMWTFAQSGTSAQCGTSVRSGTSAQCGRSPKVERPPEVERPPNVDVRPKWNARPMWNVRPQEPDIRPRTRTSARPGVRNNVRPSRHRPPGLHQRERSVRPFPTFVIAHLPGSSVRHQSTVRPSLCRLPEPLPSVRGIQQDVRSVRASSSSACPSSTVSLYVLTGSARIQSKHLTPTVGPCDFSYPKVTARYEHRRPHQHYFIVRSASALSRPFGISMPQRDHGHSASTYLRTFGVRTVSDVRLQPSLCHLAIAYFRPCKDARSRLFGGRPDYWTDVHFLDGGRSFGPDSWADWRTGGRRTSLDERLVPENARSRLSDERPGYWADTPTLGGRPLLKWLAARSVLIPGRTSLDGRPVPEDGRSRLFGGRPDYWADVHFLNG
ncbi:hypothetical protein LR48_Vigan03g003400 [Vigna angularis]|uniref:Uncharacterized protein n=1 Tax=Phaseolus angularis TaxID=3914 RepID=A0A0L9U1F1_PHAAN|nr:hypothetical protein LR48_Vigan03g003400 [Vigna angularis]